MISSPFSRFSTVTSLPSPARSFGTPATSMRERSARRFWIWAKRAWIVDCRFLADSYSAFSERSPWPSAVWISFGRVTRSSCSIRCISSSSFCFTSRSKAIPFLLLHREFLHVEPEPVLADRVHLGPQDLRVQLLFLRQGEEHLLRRILLRASRHLEVEPVRLDFLVDRDLEDPYRIGLGQLLWIDLFERRWLGNLRR